MTKERNHDRLVKAEKALEAATNRLIAMQQTGFNERLVLAFHSDVLNALNEVNLMSIEEYTR